MNLDAFFGAHKCLCETRREPEPMTKVSVVYGYLVGLLLVGITLWLGYEMEVGWWYYHEKGLNMMTACLQATHDFSTCYVSFIE